MDVTGSNPDPYTLFLTDLVLGRIRAGERLGENSLASRWRVGRVPVREALLRLEQDGVVERRPGSGTYVREHSPDELAELFDLRVWVEPGLARKAADRLRPDDRPRLLRLAEQADLVGGDALQREADDRAFHSAVWELSGMQQALRVMTLARLHLHCATMQWRISRLGSYTRSAPTHHPVAVAVCAGDGRAAERLMRQHLVAAKAATLADFRTINAGESRRRGLAQTLVPQRPALAGARRQAHAFTLIELLVVIAIIGVLASMLLPALQRAKEQARAALCMGALKQSGLVFQAYCDDFDRWLPICGNFVNYQQAYNRHTQYGSPYPAVKSVTPYETALRAGYIEGFEALRCPSNPWYMATNASAGTDNDGGENYSRNFLIFGDPRVDWATGAMTYNDDQATSAHAPKRPDADAQPHSLLLVADGATMYDWASCCVFTPNRRICLYWGRGSTLGAQGIDPGAWDNPPAANLNAYGYWHNGPNALFADMHVAKGNASRAYVYNYDTAKWPFPLVSYRMQSGTLWYAYKAVPP